MRKASLIKECERCLTELGNTIVEKIIPINFDTLDLLSDFTWQEKIKLYGLSTSGRKNNTFICWPLFFDDDASDRQNIIINVCACCFGALSLNLLLENSQSKWGPLAGYIQQAINSLVILQSTDGSWPSAWELAGNTLVSGNVNQTTLSISTLIRCGFFACNSTKGDNCTTYQQRKERYALLYRSILWLMNAEHLSLPVYNTGWYYSSVDTDKVSTMITSYVFDVVVKVIYLMETNREVKEYFLSQNNGISSALRNLVMRVRHFCDIKQNSDGGYSRTYQKGSLTESNAIDTCYAINMLLLCYQSDKQQTEILTKIEKALVYIKRSYASQIKKPNCFVRYPFNETRRALKGDKSIQVNRIEEYEIFPYPLFISSILSSMQCGEVSMNRRWFGKTVFEQFLILLGRQQQNNNGLWIVLGNRPSLGMLYPVYAQYYTLYAARQVLEKNDYLVLHRHVDKKMIGGLVTLSIILLIGFQFFFNDALFTVISGIATALVSFLINTLSRKSK
ncbi:MAG: hypothetical protein VB104_14240 [Candidatus Limiplasma sp.]|nr:hypothetical protein [Candidatus Limiplasma sp.]